MSTSPSEAAARSRERISFGPVHKEFRSAERMRTLAGKPRASIVPLSGVSGELIVTVAWDISWYQYRVSPESAQPVRLAERGHELAELDAGYQRWNARIEQDGRLVPEISPL